MKQYTAVLSIPYVDPDEPEYLKLHVHYLPEGGTRTTGAEGEQGWHCHEVDPEHPQWTSRSDRHYHEVVYMEVTE